MSCGVYFGNRFSLLNSVELRRAGTGTGAITVPGIGVAAVFALVVGLAVFGLAFGLAVGLAFGLVVVGLAAAAAALNKDAEAILDPDAEADADADADADAVSPAIILFISIFASETSQYASVMTTFGRFLLICCIICIRIGSVPSLLIIQQMNPNGVR